MTLLLFGMSHRTAPVEVRERYVVPPDALTDETSRLAATLASQAPVAVRRILEAVHHGLDMSLAEAAVFEASMFGLVYGTEDVREGTTAFLEKRTPRFTGQ